MSTSRWRKWTPKPSVMEESPTTALPKLPKIGFGSFGSAHPGFSQTEAHSDPDAGRPVPPEASTIGEKLEATRNPYSGAYVFPRCPGCGSFALYQAANASN